jgi:hypothetical protein
MIVDYVNHRVCQFCLFVGQWSVRNLNQGMIPLDKRVGSMDFWRVEKLTIHFIQRLVG